MLIAIMATTNASIHARREMSCNAKDNTSGPSGITSQDTVRAMQAADMRRREKRLGKQPQGKRGMLC
ncbi:MAG: hypothetical protein GXY60_12665 [Spirochaetales bacterium]|nr:hypothetical protein [Spirochaetales bacterium]